MPTDELIDVLDKTGQPTGQVLPRTEIHAGLLMHRLAHVWIINSTSEVLLQQRSADKLHYPSCWDVSANGHVEAGERSLDSIQRECAEELGLTIPLDEFIWFAEEREPTDSTINDAFFVRREVALVTLKIQTEEVQAVRWCPLDQLETELTTRPETFYQHDWDHLLSQLRPALAK